MRRLKKVVGYILLVILLVPGKAQAQKSSLPDFVFASPDGKKISSKLFDNERPLVVIYFEPTCIHCRYQAEWIARKIDQLQELDFLFVAWQPTQDIPAFKERYFPQEENIHFGVDSEEQFDDLFGFSQIPTIYIYNEQNQLVKKFKKETKPERMLKALDL